MTTDERDLKLIDALNTLQQIRRKVDECEQRIRAALLPAAKGGKPKEEASQ